MVTEAQAEAVRAAWERDGELAAAVELRRLFPGIASVAHARECARTIVGWAPPEPGTEKPGATAR